MMEINKIDVLRNIYEDVCRWLLHAEAKHVALITIVLFLEEQVLSIQNNFDCLSVVFKSIIFLICSIVLLISIGSFFPFINQSEKMKRLAFWVYSGKGLKTDNFLFYLYVFEIEMLNYGNYENKLKERLNVTDFSFLEKSYIRQICDLSNIVVIKNAVFKIEIVFVEIVGIMWCILYTLAVLVRSF